jgi:hypothetical protein
MSLVQTNLWELTKLCYAARFGFYAPDEIGHMSLNDLRRRVATIDKIQPEIRMHESSVALDLEHLVSTIATPTLSFSRLENNLLEYLQH